MPPDQDHPSPAAGFHPHVTVATLVERDGRFLFVEEEVHGARVLNQPAGHVEAGETLLEAAGRETREETGWSVRPECFVGVWLWSEPGEPRSWLRFAFAARALDHDPGQPLDAGIVAVHWLSPAELARAATPLRTPLVRATLDAFLAGQRLPLSVVQCPVFPAPDH